MRHVTEPKTEISARSAQFGFVSVGKRGFERARSAPSARDRTAAIDAGEVLTRLATRVEWAELGPTRCAVARPCVTHVSR